jgi:hypothetical protein
MNEAKEIQNIKQLLVEFEYIQAEGTEGCSEATVRKFDKHAASGRLPELYRQFLRAMGKQVNGTFMGSYLFYCEFLENIQKEAHKMVEETKKDVPADAFFFATFDYVDFFYFRTDEKNDNPPVYMVSRQREPFQLARSLRRFFGEEMGEMDEEDS